MPSKRSRKDEQVKGKHAKHAAAQNPQRTASPQRSAAPDGRPAKPQQSTVHDSVVSTTLPTGPAPAMMKQAAAHEAANSSAKSMRPKPTNAPSEAAEAQVPAAASNKASGSEHATRDAGRQSARAQQAKGSKHASDKQRSRASEQVPVDPSHSGKQTRTSAQQPTPSGYPERAKTPPAQTQTKSSKKKAAATKKKRRVPLAVKIVITVIIVAILAVGGFMVWNHLFRYDDAQDFQGQWKIEGSNNSIVITEDQIRLTDSVSFGYDLNTLEKTITYQFANYTGEGRYSFSPERDVLTLTDVSPEPDEGDTQQSMSLLKVSDQAVGEPESANNNDTSDANTLGADVVDGSMSPQQAQSDEDAAGN